LDLIVVGAGLSGLVAAHRAQRAGLQVQVIDAAPRPVG
jgi:phytoene dehydrogenase-like protein